MTQQPKPTNCCGAILNGSPVECPHQAAGRTNDTVWQCQKCRDAESAAGTYEIVAEN